jgi:hypothetical protein
MRRTETQIDSVQETGAEMERLLRDYNGDVAFADNWLFIDFYHYVRDLPYIEDPTESEALARPAISLSSKAPFRDCDDKALAMGCWLYRHGIPFRFIACSYEPELEVHHCAVQLGNYVNREGMDFKGVVVDATYPHEDEFPPARKYYNIEGISEWV